MCDAQIFLGSGLPMTGTFSAVVTSGGCTDAATDAAGTSMLPGHTGR